MAGVSPLLALDVGLQFDVSSQPLPFLLLAIVLSAILQDDFTCLAIGMYVSTDEVPAIPATLACLAGTLLGDLFWFFSGRLLGQTCLERRPFSWVVGPAQLTLARDFCERHGRNAILISRFVPVIRTPVQMAAGMFGGNVWSSLAAFAMGAAVYAPLLVLISSQFGRAVDVFQLYERFGHVALLGLALLLWTTMMLARMAFRSQSG